MDEKYFLLPFIDESRNMRNHWNLLKTYEMDDDRGNDYGFSDIKLKYDAVLRRFIGTDLALVLKDVFIMNFWFDIKVRS